MLTLKKVAVTGGMASGKTTTCNDLKKYGAHVVSADEIVHQLLHDTKIRKKIIADLGEKCVHKGIIDRTLLGNIVFNDPEKLKRLEAILHPEVLDKINKEYERVKNNKQIPFFVAEVPLLFECGWEPYFNITICVAADEPHYANKKPIGHYTQKAANQMAIEEKIKRADITIYNNGSLADLHEHINTVISQLCKEES